MAAIPRCSECGAALVYADGKPKPAGTKTCSSACRQKRARRRVRQRQESGSASPHSPEVKDIAAVVRGDVKDAAHDVLKEELRPIVRETLTADVLLGIDRLVKLQSTAIEKLEEDLGSQDETIRQRAYTLLLKYTMGNPSVAPPPAEQAAAPMSVVFNIPRPGDAAPAPAAIELRECSDCRESKPADQFVGASPKCQACFEALQQKLRDRKL